MKKLAILSLALVSLTASAQTTTPNRMLVKQGYDTKAFAISNVDEINFATVEGEIKATLEFKEYSKTDDKEMVKVAVTKSASCMSYDIAIIPASTAKAYDDATMAKYFERLNTTRFYDDFTDAEMTGFDPLKSNTDYTVVTLGYDQYGVAGSTSRVDFKTPKQETVGTPSVTWTIDETTGSSFTLTVTPNEDTKEFYWCQFDKGGAQAQFEQWGPMMGYANMEEMIKGFSWYSHTGVTSNTWDGLQPNTEYEVYVLPVDVNGVYGDMVIIPVKTAKLGGEGVAQVTITAGEVSGDATNGYYLPVTYTPNDQTSIHHDLLVSADFFEKNNYTEEQLAEAMKADSNPFGYDPYWNYVGVDEATWGCTPGETYYAYSIAMNANGEYGSLAKLEIKTVAPSAAPAKAPKSKTNGIVERIASASRAKTAVAPQFNAKSGITLKSAK